MAKMTVTGPHECAECHQPLDPGEEVVQGVEQVEQSASGAQAKGYRDGRTVVVHPECYPPLGDSHWRTVYAGPLSGIRHEPV
jgi:hypothetical protein